MSQFRQIVRWGIPGWIALIVFLGLMGMALGLAKSAGAAVPSIEPYLSAAARVSTLTVLGDYALPLAGAAVPIGFIAYQIYFWAFWSAALPSWFRKAKDPARPILQFAKQNWGHEFSRHLRRSPEHACGRRKVLGMDANSPRMLRVYQDNWQLAQAVWYRALQDTPMPGELLEELIGRATYLTDIYNGLGAAAMASLCGLIAYLLWEAITALRLVAQAGSLLPFAVMFVTTPGLLSTYALVRIMRHNRHNALWTLQSLMRDVITQAYPEPTQFSPKWRSHPAERAAHGVDQPRHGRRGCLWPTRAMQHRSPPKRRQRAPESETQA